jgi:hypothetical protein
MVTKKKILSDHKLVKKKLQPPFFHSFPGWKTQFNEVPYLYKVLPELVWQVFLNDKYGVPVASSITLKLLEIIRIARHEEKGKLFCMISNFELLTEKEIDKVLAKLFLDNDYKKIIDAILPFMRMFPDCPLKVLLYNPLSKPTKEDLVYVKSVIQLLLDKTSKEATFVLANAIYYAFQMDVLKVHADSKLLNLNQIEFYPDTEESQIIASSLRASINLFVQDGVFIKVSNNWQNYFWNQAYKLEPHNIDNLYFS